MLLRLSTTLVATAILYGYEVWGLRVQGRDVSRCQDATRLPACILVQGLWRLLDGFPVPAILAEVAQDPYTLK